MALHAANMKKREARLSDTDWMDALFVLSAYLCHAHQVVEYLI